MKARGTACDTGGLATDVWAWAQSNGGVASQAKVWSLKCVHRCLVSPCVNSFVKIADVMPAPHFMNGFLCSNNERCAQGATAVLPLRAGYLLENLHQHKDTYICSLVCCLKEEYYV